MPAHPLTTEDRTNVEEIFRLCQDDIQAFHYASIYFFLRKNKTSPQGAMEKFISLMEEIRKRR